MRVVIYDDESLEPITIVNLRGFGEKDIERHGRRYRVPVPFRLPVPSPAACVIEKPNIAERFELNVVELAFEPFVRGGFDRPKQRAWMCFTKATELAMSLNPAFLPGQQRVVDYLQEQNDKLTSILMHALTDR